MKYKVPQYLIERKLREDQKVIIYTLSHPQTNEIFYIGSTCYPAERIQQHKKVFGFKPVFTEIETVCKIGMGRIGVVAIESYWVQQFIACGFNLKNNKYNPRVKKFHPTKEQRLLKQLLKAA